MTGEHVERRLAAVLAADVAGYSRLMGRDEERTLAELKSSRKEVIDPAIGALQGRIVKTTGDGMLVEFASVVNATRCAVQIQLGMAARNTELPQDIRMEFRIGIHVGDIIIDENDIFGDGVNIAARLQGVAEPGGVCISDDAQRQIRGKVDILFNDIGLQVLKNIAEPMRAWRATPGDTATDSMPVIAPALALPDKPSIAVLPFQNMSGDPEQEYFADGMAEDIITALSRFKSLFVIARNSSFTYKGKVVDIKQAGRELGVRYVLEGSVRKAAGKVRITGQLIEAATNNHLWADRFDGDLKDVFELQDNVAASVVSEIAPQIERAEIELARRKSTDRLDSYDMFLRGMSLFYRLSFAEACVSFKEAFARDPDYAAAYAMAAFLMMMPQSAQGTPLPAETRLEVIRYAQLASSLGKEDAFSLARAAHVLTFLTREYEHTNDMIERAVILNPNLAVVWINRGWMSVMRGEPERALESFARVLRLSPLDPLRRGVWYGNACAQHGLCRYEDGCTSAMMAIEDNYPDTFSLGAFIMNAVPAGRLEEARKALVQLLSLRPHFRISHIREIFHTRDTEWAKRIAAAFREAGLPE